MDESTRQHDISTLFGAITALVIWMDEFRKILGDLTENAVPLMTQFSDVVENVTEVEGLSELTDDDGVLSALLVHWDYEEVVMTLVGCLDALRAGLCISGDVIAVKSVVGQIIHPLMALVPDYPEEEEEEWEHLLHPLMALAESAMALDNVLTGLADHSSMFVEEE
jgi:hypothetical protein